MKKVFVQIPLGDLVEINKEETHHVLRVLRHNKKDSLFIGNNCGEYGAYTFHNVTEEGTSMWKLDGSICKEEPKSPILLIQSYVKGEKMEWILQKCTELDVTGFLCLGTSTSVVKYDSKKLLQKGQRWEKIVQEAAQQCNRRDVPFMELKDNFNEIDAYLKEHFPNINRLVAYEREETLHLKDYFRKEPFSNEGVVICVGPEGGFSKEEIDNLENLSFTSVSLGSTILRAETAAMAAVTLLTYERG